MHNFFRQIYRKIIEILPTKLVLHIENFRGYHKLVNFKNPEYFGEKIQWLKLNGNLEKYNDYVNKYLVRNYIKNLIGDKYLIPLIGVYDDPSNIEYDKLPSKFVIKLNTGSGYNIVIKNKESIDINQINKKLTKWLKEDYSKMKKEPQYKNINKKIGFLKVDFDRYKNHTINFYNTKFEKMDIREGNYKNYYGKISKPENFDEMLKIVNKLCSDFSFVRVDLYNVDGKIYFGELTFTPAAGINPFIPLEKDKEIASLINLKLEKIAVLVSTVNCNNIIALLDDLKVNSDCIVVNQCNSEKEEIIEKSYKGRKLKIINSNERGLSNSRNKALENVFSDTDIIIFADDDEILSNGYESKIIKEYNLNSNADGIVFNVKRTNGRLNKKIGKKINQINLFRACSVSLSFKYSSIKNIKFDNRFGTGTDKYVCGEENIFVSDLLKNKKKIYTNDYVMCELINKRPSTWYNGIDEKILYAKGASFKRMHRYLFPFFNFDFAIRKLNEYKRNVKFLSALKMLFAGSNSIKL